MDSEPCREIPAQQITTVYENSQIHPVYCQMQVCGEIRLLREREHFLLDTLFTSDISINVPSDGKRVSRWAVLSRRALAFGDRSG